jgi:hypothetical protein
MFTQTRHSGEGRNPLFPRALNQKWVPAFAGMTV